MLVTEPATIGMQTFHHPPSDAASCFYKHKLMNDLKAQQKRSDFNNGVSDIWQNKYYGPSPPPLTPHPQSFQQTVNPPKHCHVQTRDLLPHGVGPYPHNPPHNYNQQSKSTYYPHSTISSSAPQAASNVLHWQHQQHPLQQRLSQPQPMPPASNQDELIGTQQNHRFTDIFIRRQNPAGYLLSLNETQQPWCQSPSSSKDGLFQQPVTKNICRLCGKSYARPSTLKTHMRIHSGERPFHCRVCNKSFSQAANLTAHLRVHSGEKPFSCPVCHKTFSQSSSVTTHMRTHSGDRPYKCPICRKGFSDSSTLTKHLRIHSGEKPYRCNYCSMSFSQSGNLNRHMKVHEQPQKVESGASSTSPAQPGELI
ncbi:uncharacterized protein [Watersipora subatra]|uniref:uncharacterized protein n=1 Tax=Watersipora subatra TaxID=2589382 RepID=UPI00355C4D92